MRHMEQTGLVLEGGGMRGIFTAGVLDYFLDEKIEFDNCIGVSAGSCHACSYLSKQRGRAYDTFVKYMNDKRYCSVRSLITTGNLFGTDFVYNIIPNQLLPIDAETYLKSKTKLYATVTNCITGEAEYLEVKDVKKDVDYIRASSSLPLISKLVEINGTPYLDGGIADSIPIEQSIKLGNTKNIVVLTRPRDYQKKKSSAGGLIRFAYRKYPKFIEASENRHLNYNKTLSYIWEQEKQGTVLVIQPEHDLGIGRLEKNEPKLKAAYQYGYDFAKQMGNQIKEYLGCD